MSFAIPAFLTRRLSTPAMIVGALGAFLVLFTIQLSYGLYSEYRLLIDDAERDARNYAIAIEQNVARVIEATDSELRRVAESAPQRTRQTGYDAELKNRTLDLDFIDVLAVLDDKGIGLANSDAPVGIGTDYSDRAHFRIQRDYPGYGLFLGAPIKRRNVAGTLIPLSRRVENPDGSFAGVAVASLDGGFFRRVVGLIDLGPNSDVTVYLKDGTILARLPDNESWFGQNAGNEPLFTEHLARAANGLFATPKDAPNGAQIVAYRSLLKLPLIVSVAVSQKEALASWRGRANEAAMFWLAAIGVYVLMAFYLFRYAAARGTAMSTVRAREARLSAIIDNSTDSILTLDDAGRIESFNRSAELMFGKAEAEMIGRPIADILTPVNKSSASQMIGGMLPISPSSSGSQEMTAQRSDGTSLNLELRINEMRIRGALKYNLIIRDVTERIRSEEQLRQSQRLQAVGQLTGGVAHEFNNILMIVLGGAELLALKLAGNKEGLAIAERIETAALRGADLTRSLLAFSRRQPLEPKSLASNDVVREAIKLAHSTLSETIKLEAKLAESAWAVTADRTQLNNAILNLIINARDAMPAGGKISVETANMVVGKAGASENLAPGRYVAIVVRDDGQGMTPDVMRQAFEPFFTTKEVGKGTGLGLSMVLGFARQSGGDARLASVPGMGTTVTVLLPATDQAAMSDAAQPFKIADQRATILLAEDDQEVLTTAAESLRMLGYEVLTALDGPTALRLMNSAVHIDLLLTDVVMPKGMTGLDLARQVQKRQPDVEIIYTSGYNENVIVHHGVLDSGIVLLRKPYTISDLAETVERALAKRHARHA